MVWFRRNTQPWLRPPSPSPSSQATAKGALKAVPVAVSGAFHTELMQPARDALTEASSGLVCWGQRPLGRTCCGSC